MEPIEIKRAYVGSDAHMTESARVIHTLMFNDLAAFTAFDTTINAAFAAQYLAAIDAADTVITDDVVIDELVEKTEYVVTAMDKARSKYRQIKYFVQETFPTSTGIQGQFGLNDYEKARKSTPQMIIFLDTLYKKCDAYKVQLIAKGCTQARIDEILVIRDELQDTNNDQEVFKKDRPKYTEDRIIILNACYKTMVKVNAAAQLVYETDYAKKNQFVYISSPTGTNDDDGDEDDLTGTVEPSSVKTVTTIDEDATITMSNTGTEKLYFALSPTEGAGGIDFTVHAGETLTKSSSDMSPEGDGEFLLVKNPETVIGSYEVVIEI